MTARWRTRRRAASARSPAPPTSAVARRAAAARAPARAPTAAPPRTAAAPRARAPAGDGGRGGGAALRRTAGRGPGCPRRRGRRAPASRRRAAARRPPPAGASCRCRRRPTGARGGGCRRGRRRLRRSRTARPRGRRAAGRRRARAGRGAARAAPRPRSGGARGLRRLQRVAFEVRLLAQDPLFEPAQLGPRLEPELAVQGLPQAAVRGEGVGLPAAPVEGEHQLAVHALAHRVLGGEPLEPGHRHGVPSEREVGVHGELDGAQPQLLELRDLGLGERLVGEVRERLAAPQPEGLRQRHRRGRRIARGERLAPGGDERREVVDVELTRGHAQHVGAGVGLEQRRRGRLGKRGAAARRARGSSWPAARGRRRATASRSAGRW